MRKILIFLGLLFVMLSNIYAQKDDKRSNSKSIYE